MLSPRILSLLFIFLAVCGPLTLAEGTFSDNRSAFETEASPDGTLVQAQSAEERIADAVRYLASDELEGRGIGKEGLANAAQFIANSFSDAGLRVDLWDGTPYQTFRVSGMSRVTSSQRNRLQFSAGAKSRTLELNQEFRPMAIGKNATFSGGLAFVGYGIQAQGEGWSYDEYADVDVRGKAVIVLRKEPQQADPNSPFDGQQTTRHSFFANKISIAYEHGAAAVLFVNDFVSLQGGNSTNSRDTLPPSEAAGKSTNDAAIPVFFITRQVVQDLFDLAQSNVRLDQIEEKIDAELTPQSFELPSIEVDGESEIINQDVLTSNVVGVLPGAGSLAEQAIVIGAHYDHVGMGEYGSLAPGVTEIHNGADDNASGTAALMELARRFQNSRSDATGDYRKIIFIAFSGEERGLLGSKYYVQHPVAELSQTVAMLNMDMVGRLGNNEIIVYGTGSSPRFPGIVRESSEQAGLIANQQRPAMGPSDHQPFFENGVPILHFFTGIHPQYHRPSDDFEKINTSGIVRITDMVYQLADQLASQPDRPGYVRVGGRANIQIPSNEQGRLGIRLSGTAENAFVQEVVRGGAADEAGVQVSDVVIQIDGQSIATSTDLLEKMKDYMPADIVQLRVLRGEKSLEIPVQLGH